MADYHGKYGIELVPLNGEDYYSVPGQMLDIHNNRANFNNILLNINIDGAGYKEGKSAFSFYDVPQAYERTAKSLLKGVDGATIGPQWTQGDHSIFLQYGCSALAVSSLWFIENMDSQDITHTEKDSLAIVDVGRVAEIAEALDALLRSINR